MAHIKTLTCVVITSVILYSCGGGEGGSSSCTPVANTNFEASEPLIINLPVTSQSEFYLNGVDGSITVTGVSGGTTLVINGNKRVQSESSTDAMGHLADLSIKIQDITTALLASTNQPTDKCGRNYIIDYVISLPDFMFVSVNNVNGVVTLGSLNNNVSVANISGNINLNDIYGSATTNLIAGTTTAMITLPLNGTIDFTTLSGNINLSIPANTSADLAAKVKLGNINTTNLVILNLIVSSTTLSGTLGSGQGTIVLEATQIGDIQITGL